MRLSASSRGSRRGDDGTEARSRRRRRSDNALALSELLVLWGYDVCTADDVAGALRTTNERRPDIVVLDLSTTGADAADVVRALKASGAAVVAFSGWSQLEDPVRKAGADAFVLKPAIEKLEAWLRTLGSPETRRNDAC
jgi:DNA-binding response OmpR family regulator